MLKLGEKGAIVQRDNQTYAVAPHIPCGVITPQVLRKLADVAEKYGAKALKITGATRIAIVGVRETDIDAIWSELGMSPGAAVGLCVRSIRACPGTTFCKLGKQDALGVGLALDEKYHGVELPGKFKMAVSGCVLNCSESWVRDVGLTGYDNGWMLTAGGNVGAKPRIGQELCKGLSNDQAFAMVEKVLHYYKTNAKRGERLGTLLDRLGLDSLKSSVEG
jgi:NAD(P)H-nitrite reductase large subunit